MRAQRDLPEHMFEYQTAGMAIVNIIFDGCNLFGRFPKTRANICTMYIEKSSARMNARLNKSPKLTFGDQSMACVLDDIKRRQ